METEKQSKPKLLIITGPQGSGNHLFSKIFAMHPAVQGWRMMWNEWQGHHEEPFSQYWQDPTKLKDFELVEHPNYVTSISCPYFKDKQPQIPKYKEFIKEAESIFDVTVAVIGRDRNILEYQQQRVRNAHTTPQLLQLLEDLPNVHYISHELLFLYQGQYLKSLSKQLDFPIAHNHKTLLDDFLKTDSNRKYIQNIDKGKFDDEVAKACKES